MRPHWVISGQTRDDERLQLPSSGRLLSSLNVYILKLTLDVFLFMSLNGVLTTSKRIRNRYDNGRIRPSVERRPEPLRAA